MKRNLSRCIIGFIVLSLLLSVSFFAYKVNDDRSNLGSLAFVMPELRVSQTGEDFRSIQDGFSSFDGAARFLSENDASWRILIDLRRGVPSLIDGGAIPWIPGPANSLSWSSFAPGCGSIQCIPREKVEVLAREFLDKYPGLFPVKQEELVIDPNGTVPVWDSIYLVRFQWTIDGIPVEGASIYFIINNGNLISVSSTRVAPQSLDTRPAVTKETAWDIMNGYLGGEMVTDKDEILERGMLSIIPTTRKGMDTFSYSGTIGSMADYRLVYKMVFRRPGVTGTWEATVDAHSGELLRFVDINRYGRIHGGAKTSDGIPPDQDVPFPYADTGLAAPNNYTDELGNFPGNNATSTLNGKYAVIDDDCGSISLTTTTGDADFLTDLTTGADCVVPSGNPAGLGNTKSARTQFYNLTAINLKAQVYNPSNTWLTSYTMTAHTNQSPWCNATSGGGTVNFYQKASGCNNLGEIPGVSMHEWAHAYDDEDGSGAQSPPLETYADFTAIIQTHNSCTGAGFMTSGNCDGYGDPCTDCSGVRDCDWRVHQANTPWTVANNADNGGTVWDSCGTGSYQGPCGWEDHCEAGFSTQALWDFATHDLTDYCGLDLTTAWMLLDRLWFTGVITIDDMYTCTGSSSSGCTGNTLYNVLRTLDDDGDGTANGTPHAQAIFQAMNRHGIACGAAGDATNQNNTSCPSLTTPVLTASGGNNSVKLDWTTGGVNATRYYIYKNASNCDVAFNRIAIVTAPTLTYTDNACLNGYTYYYRVQAATANDSCVSASSNCATGIPVECTGSPALDKTVYSCSSTVNVSVGDSSAPTSPFTCEAWSTSDTTHRTFTMTGAGSPYTGSFTTTSGAGGPGVVHVTAGDTLYVQYTDPDNCGGGPLAVQTTASIDCTGPTISNVAVTNITGTTATVTWTTNENANSRVTYGTSTPPGTNQDNLTSYVTGHTINLAGLTPCTQYYFSVTSADVAGNSVTDTNGGSYYTFTTPNMPVTVWSENFTSATPTALPAGWSESHTSGNAWVTNASGCTGNALMYPYNYSAAANSYAYTPGITLTAGMTYTLSFNQKVYSGSYPEIFEVKCGTAATPAGQTITVLASASYTNTTCQALSGNFTVPTTGTYYLSFHCTSTANMWNLYIDDIVLSRPGTCGPDLSYQSNTFADSCGSGGAGNGDGYIDAGESVTVHPVLMNVGGMATGVSATLSTTTPGITVTTAMASYPDIAPLGTASCNAPHFVYSVGTGVACGTVIDFTLTITAAGGGPWTGNFTHTVGNVIPANGTAYLEDFENISTWSNWTVTTGPGPHTCGPFARVNTASQRPTTGSGYYALSDSDACGSGSTTSTILTSPVIDCSNAAWTAVTLEYDIYYNYYNGDDATVQVYNGSAWQTVWTDTNADLNAHQSINVTTHALGNANFRVRFSYQNASWDYWYAVDNVKVSYTAPPGCNMTACAGGCSNPTQPTIGSVTDLDACAQSGVRVTFTAGSPSTSNSLLVDGAEMATGITSPYDYNPGNTASHSYVVRTYNTASCHTDSTATARADANNTPTPTITGDSANTCPATTVQLSTENGMSSYQWYVGGSPIGGANAYQYTVSASGTYTVSYTNGSGCSGTSAGHAVTISSCAVVPGEVASGGNFTWSGQTMNWTADANATGYRVYRGLLSNLSALCDATNDFCLRNDGAGTSFDVTGDDPAGQSGRCFYFLITGYSGAGEGPAGTATCGTRTVNSSGGCS